MDVYVTVRPVRVRSALWSGPGADGDGPLAPERAGVKPFGCHDIRGLSATMSARADEPTQAIQELLRHGNLVTTERYLRKSGLARSAVKTFKGRFGHVG